MKFLVQDFRGKLRRWLLSVPLFFKVVGVGALVSIIFGSVIYLEISFGSSRLFYNSLASASLLHARGLATRVERPLLTGDLYSVYESLAAVQEEIPNFVYAVVYDSNGKRIASRGSGSNGSGVRSRGQEPVSPDGTIEVHSAEDGLLFSAAFPILEGHLGVVELGLADRDVRRELTVMTRTVLIALLLCMGVGISLAAVLSYVINRPVQELTEIAMQVRNGRFDARAAVHSSDEVGKLAAAFNEMSDSLQTSQQEVQKKEKARRALLERIVSTQETERQVIARELHDEVGQSLAATLLQLQTGCKFSTMKGSLCSDLETSILTTIDDVRRLAWGIRPPILDDHGLDGALEHYVEETARHSGVRVDYHYSYPPGKDRLPRNIELTLYRVVQETMLNTIRHAQASRVSVTLVRQDSKITLVVEDDGRGFDPDHIDSSRPHLGLLGIEERLSSCGGTLCVESAPGEGCAIQARIPL